MKEGEGMIMDCNLHDLIKALAKVEKNAEEQKRLHLENENLLTHANECLNKLVLQDGKRNS